MFESRILRTAGRRHILTLVLSVLLVSLFGVVHGQWSDMHRWNKAAADASFLLLTATMAIGPAGRLWPRLRRLVPVRREFGIYAIVLALVHTLTIFDGWIEWNFARLFGLEFHPGLGHYVMLQHGFGLANAIGLLALVYGMVLALTSSDRALRLLGGPTWKFIQGAAYVLWALVVVHTAYFLYMHFLDFHRATPEPNPLQGWFVSLVVLVLGLRIGASVLTWRQKRNRSWREGDAQADPAIGA